jgi:hypothetical protein
MAANTHEGLAIGHARANDAALHAGDSWVSNAIEAFRAHALTNQRFTTEEVRQAYPDLPAPPDKRAWGAVPRIAQREGIVMPHGWVRASSPTVHGMVVTLWESKTYKGAIDQ